MFVYEKKLEYPIRIKNSNPALAKFICSQYGGPDGELGASLRYLSQRYAMPYPELSAILTDIGTEELGHLEMVGTIVYQLTRSMTPEQIKQSGYDTYFVDHTAGVFPQFASGTPWTSAIARDTAASHAPSPTPETSRSNGVAGRWVAPFAPVAKPSWAATTAAIVGTWRPVAMACS